MCSEIVWGLLQGEKRLDVLRQLFFSPVMLKERTLSLPGHFLSAVLFWQSL